MTTLQQLKDSGKWEVFVDESIIKPHLIKFDDQYYTTTSIYFGDLFQLIYRVVLVRINPGTTEQTSLGPIQQRTVNIDDVHSLMAEGPYFPLLHKTPIENQKMYLWCRRRLWEVDIGELPNKLSNTPTVIKL